jgi:hypothetical protein
MTHIQAICHVSIAPGQAAVPGADAAPPAHQRDLPLYVIHSLPCRHAAKCSTYNLKEPNLVSHLVRLLCQEPPQHFLHISGLEQLRNRTPPLQELQEPRQAQCRTLLLLLLARQFGGVLQCGCATLLYCQACDSTVVELQELRLPG